MDQIYLLKRVDIIAQLLCLILPWGNFFIFHWPAYLTDMIILSYLLVGSAQVISCVANKFALPAKWKLPQRRGYEAVLIIVLVLFVFSLISRSYGIMESMLYTTPLLVLWYIAITIRELLRLRSAVNQIYPMLILT